MKNLLIYVNPNNLTDGWGEIEKLIRIQIDNSYILGWKKDDIMLVTNFPYEYNGIKSTLVNSDNYYSFKPTATKINTIVTLFEQGLEDDLYWFHDFDAFQLKSFKLSEVDVRNQIGITDYGITRVGPDVDRRWSTGIIFFRKDTKDVFEWIKDAVYKYQANEEISLLAMCRHNKHGINERIKKLDITYNLATRKRKVSKTYEIAEKPLRVIHFHPFDKRPVELGYNNIEVVMGKNKLNKILITDTLINLFKQNDIFF